MSDSIFILEPLLNAQVRDVKFQLLLKACNEQQALAYKPENKVRDVIKSVNARLNELGPRPSGIQLLKTFLAQCSDRVFVENSVSWMTQCLKAAVNPQSAYEAYEVLRTLVDMSHHFQELTKPISGQIIPKLLDHLLRCKKSPAALQCLEVVLHHYPGPCKDKAKLVQKFLLAFVDEDDKELVEFAGRCMCYLPLLLTTGRNDGTTWTDVQTELCATVNSLMYEVFENVHELPLPPVLSELPIGFKLKALKEKNPVLALHHVATRVINLLNFVEGMLLGDLSNVKAVRADLLIALAHRILTVNCKMVSFGSTMEHVALVCVLPEIHIAVLNVLQTLVSCCHGGLMKYGPLFCKFVSKTLKWTSIFCGYGVERPYRHLREVAYKFLESWVTRAKAASCVELLSEELITQMLNDIYQKKESVTLQFQEKGKTSSSQELLPQIRQHLADPKVNTRLCETALGALCAIVQSSGSLLSSSLHMRVQEVVIALLLEVERSSGPEDMPTPYSVTGCRVLLYQLLLTLTLHPHPRWPPPTQFALSLFSLGQNDCSLEVASLCTMAVACTRQMVHPSQSSHQFPMSVEEMRAAVGLPNLEPVRGQEVNVQNEQDKTKNGEIEMADRGFNTSSPHKLQQTPPLKSSFERKDVSQNSGKSSRKKPRASNELPVNGVDSGLNNSDSYVRSHKKKYQSPQMKESVSDKKSYLDSDKPCKNMQHLQFTVEKLVSSKDRKSNRNSEQDWEVVDVLKVARKQTEKKAIKSSESLEASVGTKRPHDSPTNTSEKHKTRKLNESPCKQDVQRESVTDLPKDVSLDSNTIVNCQENVEALVKMNDTAQKGTMDIAEKDLQQEKVVKQGISEEDNCIKAMDVEIKEHENEKQKQGAETTNCIRKTDEKGNEDDIEVLEVSKEEQEKNIKMDDAHEVSPSSVKRETNRYHLRGSSTMVSSAVSVGYSSNSGKGENNCEKSVLNGSPDKGNECTTNTLDKCNSPMTKSPSSPMPKSPRAADSKTEINMPKDASPVVELLLSSDSESDQQKRASGVYRRITRSIAKRASTPYRSKEQGLAIEELPSSQDSFTTESEISRLEDESALTITDPSVDLADSDESVPIVLRLDSDTECMEIVDVTNDITENQGRHEKEKGEMAVTEETSDSVSPVTSSMKNVKDSVASDREMEEGSEGMEAVADSPDVALEEFPSGSGKEDAAKKSTADIEEGSGSESTEEDILKTFVDVVSPKSV